MIRVPDELRRRLRQAGQEHVLAWWDQLTDDERRGLLAQLHAIDLAQLQQLFTDAEHLIQMAIPILEAEYAFAQVVGHILVAANQTSGPPPFRTGIIRPQCMSGMSS